MNASDKIFEEIRSRILNGELRSGEPLKERDLCAQLDVSRTPVREALRRLSAEGLAETRPRRSIVVASFDPSEIDEIFSIGIMLESFLCAKAAEKGTDEEIDYLHDLLTKMDAVGDFNAEEKYRHYMKLDHAFHDTLTTMARSERIKKILQQTISLRLLVNVFDQYKPEDFETSRTQHRAIYNAVSSRNPDWARSAMDSHIRTGRGTARPS